MQAKEKRTIRGNPEPTPGCCNAKTRNGRYCARPLGFGTSHYGQSRCKNHGGMTPTKTGLYSEIITTPIRERIKQFEESGRDPFDLIPEAQLIRALAVDYVERYDAFRDALMAWHVSYQSGANENPKPLQLLDISDAAKIADRVGSIIEKAHKIRTEGSITLATFQRLLEQMGLAVARRVAALSSINEDERAALLTSIETDWGAIRVDGAR